MTRINNDPERLRASDREETMDPFNFETEGQSFVRKLAGVALYIVLVGMGLVAIMHLMEACGPDSALRQKACVCECGGAQ